MHPVPVSFVRSLGLGLLLSASSLAAQAANDPEVLLSQFGCIVCHARDSGNTLGPSFKMIAQRYRKTPGALDTLVKKVQQGGSGNWGPTNMPPQPVSDVVAKDMVRWILKLK